MTDQPKPKRGDCGTCHWFERFPATPGMDARNGLCLVRPPVPAPIMQQVPGSRLSPQGPQAAPSTIGLLPPVSELARCAEWWAPNAFDDDKKEQVTHGNVR